MKSVLLATVLVALLAMSCAYCVAIAPERNIAPSTHLGGPLYRVFDVDEIDSIDALYAVEIIYRLAEECTGIERDFAPVRVFLTSKIMIRREGGWHEDYAGMRTWNKPWIYIKRTKDVRQLAWTMKHEFVHYITDLGHPESDDALKACDVYRTAKVR